ncbi:MAG: DUF177 domain-containing protein [Patescibacteria group bacterium]|mgnify:CR=1 FL=1
MLTFKIASLLSQPDGVQEKYELDESLSFVDDPRILPTARITVSVLLMNLTHEVNVQLKDIMFEIEMVCDRCLRHFKQQIHIPLAEREFITDLDPSDISEDEDIFLVDMRTRTIDITEMLRQEILLHFPSKAVCLDGCKGFCSQCGVDLNERACDCKQDGQMKPLKFLRKLLDM